MARAPRADAVRNRARILDAAREQISNAGAEAGMDEIAAAAGVAVGTVYRHFPTKQALVRAVLDEYTAQVADAAEAARARQVEGAPAVDELIGLLRWIIEISATNHAAKAVAESFGEAALDPQAESRATAAVADLLAQAHADGSMRADLTVEDLYLLVSTAPYGVDVQARERWLDLVVPALTT